MVKTNTKEDNLKSVEGIRSIFESSGLSDEMLEKIETLYNASISMACTELEDLAEQYCNERVEELEDLAEQYCNERVSEINESVSLYMDYITDQWINENQVAIESGVRQEITEAFINDMRAVFENHNIELPADKVDLYEEAQKEISQMKSKVKDLTEAIMHQKAIILESTKKDIARELAEGMVDTQKDKFNQLLEDVDANSAEIFREKAQYIKESFFKDVKFVEKDSTKKIPEDYKTSSAKKRYASFITESSKTE